MFRIVFFQHPEFLGSHSMARFAEMLRAGFTARGYETAAWAPRDFLHHRVAGWRGAKWAGYLDQYLLFPREVKRALQAQPANTLYVFCDQALGPWVPLVADRPHVVHCHDLLALRCALGEVPENRTRWTGRIYQRYIRKGFQATRSFIANSGKSLVDLRHYGGVAHVAADVVYNGLNTAFKALPRGQAIKALDAAGLAVPPAGFLLHVGGGQWYKNREGVVRLYARYAATTASPLPLWMVGPPPDGRLQALIDTAPAAGRIEFHQRLSDDTLAAAYSLARAFLFPSLAEGFGWPIAEALACGCQVITTGEPPMTEVGGDVAHYLPRMQLGQEEPWAVSAAGLLQEVLALPDADRALRAARGLEWVKRFDATAALDAYEAVYRRAFDAAGARQPAGAA